MPCKIVSLRRAPVCPLDDLHCPIGAVCRGREEACEREALVVNAPLAEASAPGRLGVSPRGGASRALAPRAPPRAVTANPRLTLEQYLHQLMPALLTCLVAKKLSATPEEVRMLLFRRNLRFLGVI